MGLAVRKEHKYYLWDWGLIEDQGKRFENFIAVQLQRAVSAWIAFCRPYPESTTICRGCQ
jgi:hypothetical protein